jgi:hypothetical protein
MSIYEIFLNARMKLGMHELEYSTREKTFPHVKSYFVRHI